MTGRVSSVITDELVTRRLHVGIPKVQTVKSFYSIVAVSDICRLQTARLQTADCQTAYCILHSADCRLQIAYSGSQAVDCTRG